MWFVTEKIKFFYAIGNNYIKSIQEIKLTNLVAAIFTGLQKKE